MNSRLHNRHHYTILIVLCCMLFPLGAHGRPIGGARQASVFIDDSPALKALWPDFTAGVLFHSHLPIVVLEAADEPAAPEGAAAMRMAVYDAAPPAVNVLAQPPSVAFHLLVREMSVQPGSGKKDYFLTLSAPQGDAPAAVALVSGLPEDSEWILRGSTQDKGMLRNGLAYELGRIFFPEDTPHTRYCELFFKRDGKYYYEGLHILSESVRNLYKAKSARSAENALFQYSPAADMKNTPGRQAEGGANLFGFSLRERGFSIVYSKGDNSKITSRMEVLLDKLQDALSSYSPPAYLKYPSFIDQDSVVNLYLLNTLLLNSHEARIPFYAFMERNEPLKLLPTWGFDRALDNAATRSTPLSFEAEKVVMTPPSILARRVPVWRQLEEGKTIADMRLYPVYRLMDGHQYLWFDQLYFSRSFLSDLNGRYRELRRGPLAPQNIAMKVDALAESLGPALVRDWFRWEREYSGQDGPYALAAYSDPEGESFTRQTYSYDQELTKIRYCLAEQDSFFMKQLAQLNWLSADLFDEATSGNMQAGYALLSFIAFLFMTHMLTRKL